MKYQRSVRLGATLAALWCVSTSSADVLRLADGTTHEGTLVSCDVTTIEFRTEKETLHLARKGVDSILFRSWAPAAKPATAPEKLKQVVLTETFDKGLGELWAPIAAAGGNYSRFARFNQGKLTVAVPGGNSWGKTGIRSKKPLFTVDASMNDNPMRVVLDFDAGGTGFIAALGAVSSPDVVHTTNTWFHWYVRPPGPNAGRTEMYLINWLGGMRMGKSAGATTAGTPPKAPRQLVFWVKPGSLEVTQPAGQKLSLAAAWLTVGAPVFLHVHSHPAVENEPAGFVLDTVTVGR